MMVDVLVVGAGPAGSCAARELAESGLDVLVIDRRRELGHPVQCGEFLPTTDELRRILPRSEEYGDLFDIDDGLVEKRISRILMFDPQDREYALEFSGMTLNRREFDKRLWLRAERAGARLRMNTEFLGVPAPSVARTSAGDLEYRYLVGADGPLSRVRTSISLQRPEAISQAITSQVEGEFGCDIRMYFSGIAPGGYAWVIPKKRRANIGLGIQRKFTQEKLSTLLGRFLDRLGVEAGETTYGQIPISGPIPRTASGRTLLVGDAAGQVMATNGGGIPIAMICGRIAGRCIARAAEGADDISDYETQWRKQIEGPLKNAARTKRLADGFFHSDRMLAVAMRILGSRGLRRAILCKRIFYLL